MKVTGYDFMYYQMQRTNLYATNCVCENLIMVILIKHVGLCEVPSNASNAYI